MDSAPDTASPIERLRRSLPDLPERLREAGRFIAEHEFDATTRSMRDLAGAAGLQPATFTRLARAIGHAGWEAFRHELIEAHRPGERAPFSGRIKPHTKADGAARLLKGMLDSDASAIGRIEVDSIARAATVLHHAGRIWVAGFRSCRSVASLLHYQLRLFRADVQLVGGSGLEDVDFGAFAEGDAVVVIGFAPYSRQSVQTVIEARRAACTIVTLADRPAAPIAEGAKHLLLFDADSTPAFFPSLAGAISSAQALAAALLELDGEAGQVRLRASEARLAALAQYVPTR